MASSRVREWNDASGAHTELLRPDGSWSRWTNGELIAQSGPDPDRAEAFSAGSYDAVAEAIRYGEAFEASPYGRRILEQERRAGERAREVSDRSYGLQRDELGLRERDSDRRYDLERDRFGLNERELDRRFGLDERSQAFREKELDRRFDLDYAGQGIDFFRVAADYGKNPRSWLDSLQFENPHFLRTFTQGLANPAFGAKGAANPGMRNVTDTVAAAQGGSGLNSNLYDPAKAIQQVIKGSPPSGATGMTGQDIATVRLLSEIYNNGAQNMREGTLESMDPDELAFAQGVWDNVSPGGGDRFMRNYGRSRIPRASNPFAGV